MKIVEITSEQFRDMLEETIGEGKDFSLLLLPTEQVTFLNSFKMLPEACVKIIEELEVANVPEVLFVPKYDRGLRHEMGMYFGQQMESAFIRFDYELENFIAVKIES
jgi:hypothetical protein